MTWERAKRCDTFPGKVLPTNRLQNGIDNRYCMIVLAALCWQQNTKFSYVCNVHNTMPMIQVHNRDVTSSGEVFCPQSTTNRRASGSHCSDERETIWRHKKPVNMTTLTIAIFQPNNIFLSAKKITDGKNSTPGSMYYTTNDKTDTLNLISYWLSFDGCEW